jgi:tetratricopeptide (TPR) repeat protein
VLFRLAEYADAIHHLEQANQLQPANQRTLYYLALAHVETNRLDRAAELLTQLLAMNEQDADAHYQFGLLMVRQNLEDAAAEHFATALRIDPSFHEARDSLQRLQK